MSLAEALRDDDPATRVAAMQELVSRGAAAGDDEVEALIDCLADPRKLVQRRAAEALATLSAADPRVRPALFRALELEPWRPRWGALFALSLAGEAPEEGLETLMEVLSFADGDLRWAAADLLRRLAERSSDLVVARLLRVAESGLPQERKMALYCLRDLNAHDDSCLRAVESALGCDDVHVRLSALAALARLAADRTGAARRIARVLSEDPDPRLRRTAAAILGPLGDSSAETIGALRQATRSNDPSVRRAAERSLRLLGAARP